MANKTHSVGDIIDARCSKCRKVTNHLIVAIVDIKPTSVECNTCKGIHRYRAPSVVSQAGKRVSDTSTIKQEDWDTLHAAINSITAQEYNMDTAYRVGSFIKHPSFGTGLVQRLVGKRKMEILFEEGKKLMRCK